MQTVVINGVAHVEVGVVSPEKNAITPLARDLQIGQSDDGRYDACSLCENVSEGLRSSTLCCPVDGYLVRADLYPLLKMRVKP